jgi:hypothetical protein
MGISVKSRSRTETDFVSIPNDNFAKAEAACAAFGWIPYFAIVVDASDAIRGFVLSMRHLLELCPKGKMASGWKMTPEWLAQYAADEDIKTFEFRATTKQWW